MEPVTIAEAIAGIEPQLALDQERTAPAPTERLRASCEAGITFEGARCDREPLRFV